MGTGTQGNWPMKKKQHDQNFQPMQHATKRRQQHGLQLLRQACGTYARFDINPPCRSIRSKSTDSHVALFFELWHASPHQISLPHRGPPFAIGCVKHTAFAATPLTAGVRKGIVGKRHKVRDKESLRGEVANKFTFRWARVQGTTTISAALPAEMSKENNQNCLQ